MSRETDSQLDEFNRKLKNAAKNRQQITQESQSTIRQQRMTIERLKRENEGLREELATLSRNKGSRETTEMAKINNDLNVQFQTLKRKDDAETSRLSQLRSQVKTMTARVKDLIVQRDGINKATEEDEWIQKQIKTLENKLDKSLIRFNEALAINRSLREEIDNLRTERQVFDEIYQKLEHDLHVKKKQMADIIEESNIAYEERDQALAELGALKISVEKEKEALDREFRDIDLALEEDKRKKAQLRMREGPQAAATSSADEDGRQSPNKGGQWNEAVEAASQEVASEKVRQQEDAIQRIKDATGLSEIDTIIDKFLAAEEQNFSLFNYVNDLNNEIEKFEENIQEMRSEIQSLRGLTEDTSEKQQRMVQDLDEKLQNTQKRSNEFELKQSEALSTLDSLRDGIDALFQDLGCQFGSSAEILGDNTVTESNMMQYLGSIEQRANELLQLYAAIQGPELSAEFGTASQSLIGAAVFGMGPQTPFQSTHFEVNPPNAGDEIDEDSGDDDIMPLSREQLENRAKASAEKRARMRRKSAIGKK